MGHIDISGVEYALSDGRVLLSDVSFRVGDGAKVALIGPNGSGKTTLIRMICGDISPDEGTVAITGGLGVMRQFIGSVRDETTVRQLLTSVAPARIREAAARITETENAMNADPSEKNQMAYAQAIIDWGDCGGYDFEVIWDKCCTEMLDKSFDEVTDRLVSSLSGGEQKKLVLRALLDGPEEVLLLDEPDNYLDVPSKRWLEKVISETKKSVLFISHDRELLQNTATRIVALEQGVNGNTAWVHGGLFDTWHDARNARNARFAELLLRWQQEHQRLKDLVRTLQIQAASSHAMSSKYHAMQTRLRKFEEVGPPEAPPIEQDLNVGLRGGRTGLRALTFENISITNLSGEVLTQPFDFEVFFGLLLLGADQVLFEAGFPAERRRDHERRKSSPVSVNAVYCVVLLRQRVHIRRRQVPKLGRRNPERPRPGPGRAPELGYCLTTVVADSSLGISGVCMRPSSRKNSTTAAIAAAKFSTAVAKVRRPSPGFEEIRSSGRL
jgi:ATPase subunit of ABC transporter with duplicated ATPase domains